MIAPPYYAFDADELLAHFAEAARACDPTAVLRLRVRGAQRLRRSARDDRRRCATRRPTSSGLKVSDTPWERFSPYLVDGLDIFVGPEALIPQGLAHGATGAVSGLAASFPDAVVALVRDPTPENGARVGALRASLQALPFHAASKMVLGLRGVPVRGGVRAPLRDLNETERDEVERIVREWHG